MKAKTAEVSAEELLKIKTRVRELEKLESRLQGREEQLLNELRQKYQCGSLTDARNYLTALKEQEEALAIRLREVSLFWKEKWEDKLRESSGAT